MNTNINICTGMYIAYPTSSVLKSIYKAKHYKTEVNDQHTKVGITELSFLSSEHRYITNFGGEVKFIPVSKIAREHLKNAEQMVIMEMKKHFGKVGYSREWFDTTNRKKIKKNYS